MVLKTLYKLNAFKSISIALSQIISENSDSTMPSIGEIQKRFHDFASIAFEQYKLKQKANKKLPSWCAVGCLFEQRALEQATSEMVARWKAHNFNHQQIISLTGGLGIDEWAFASSSRKVLSTDTNSDLNVLVRLNMGQLGVTWDRQDLDAAEFIHNADADSLIYIDPDRRSGQDRLGSNIESYSPNFLDLLDNSHEEMKFLIKLSPLTDIVQLQSRLSNYHVNFYSVYFQQEVKELLVYIDKSKLAESTFSTVYVSNPVEKSQTINEDVLLMDLQTAEDEFLFEPHGGLNVLRLNQILTHRNDMLCVVSNSTLFLTNKVIPASWGRSKRVIEKIEGSIKSISNHLKKAGYEHCSVTTKGGFQWVGHKATGDTIRKLLGLQESDVYTLFVIKPTKKNRFVAWLTESIS